MAPEERLHRFQACLMTARTHLQGCNTNFGDRHYTMFTGHCRASLHNGQGISSNSQDSRCRRLHGETDAAKPPEAQGVPGDPGAPDGPAGPIMPMPGTPVLQQTILV